MAARTFGIEEELLLVSPVHGHPSAAADDVVPTATELAPHESSVEFEFKKEQAEIGSDPASTADEARAGLRRLRRTLAAAAGQSGVQVAAIATSPYRVRPTATDNPRYRRMTDEFGLVARQQLTCGQHVHVGINSRAEGVGALDRIGVWLPVILAMSVNSPFWQGQDSGYASYRTLAWSLWPTALGAMTFGNVETYDRTIAQVIASGAALDDGMIYFDARLSAHWPTLEIRVADVCTDVEDAVLIGVLCRALVETACRDWSRGRPAPALRPELRRAATWRAARHGLSGTLVDLRSARQIPAFDLLEAMVSELAAALTDVGDLELVREGVERLRAKGTGADQQRTAFAAHSQLRAVVADAVERTLR